MIITAVVLYLVVGVALVCLWRLDVAEATGDEFFSYDEQVVNQIVSFSFAAIMWPLVGAIRLMDWYHRRRNEYSKRRSTSQSSFTAR